MSSALLVGLLLAAMTSLVYAQGITTPLHVGATKSIRDEVGIKLRGCWTNIGDQVQLLWVSNGVINPPAFDGTPDPNNTFVEGGLSGIGALTDPSLVDEGIFGMSIVKNRPGNGSKVFVRAFNAKNLIDASFYGDSQIFTVDGNKCFDALIIATTNAMDPRDFDGDGLNNSWEKSLGTRQDNPDSDRDGMNDGDEWRAGTDLLDPNSSLAITKMDQLTGGDLELDWHSVSGRQYVVQFTSDSLAGTPTYVDVSPIVNAENDVDTTTAVITNGLELGQGHYRIKVLE